MREKQKILIVGAGVAGQELVDEIVKNLPNFYEIIGLVDDDPKKQKQKINSFNVLGNTNELPQLISKYHINEVFIAIPSGEGETVRRIIDLCREVKVQFKIIPRLSEIVEGKVKLQQVREIQVEDILGRAILKSSVELFKKKFKNKTILITGAAGSIGSEICRQLVSCNPKKIIALDWSENGLYELGVELKEYKDRIYYSIANIRDYKKLYEVMREYNPEIVFHAAAYKHVPLMQIFPEEAIKNNVAGTHNVARAAYERGVEKFVYLSTDKAVNPTSIMGATKLVGEKIISGFNNKNRTQYCAVRFGNVFGSVGSVVPTFKRQIAKGGPVTVTDKRMIRYFMSIPEAVQLVLHASILSTGGEVFVLDMGEQIKIDNLARTMIRLAGFIPDEEIKINYTGVRPGEKMSEELFNDEENVVKTSIDRIRMAKNKNGKIFQDEDLTDLLMASEIGDNRKIYQILKKYTPYLKWVAS